MGNASSLPPLLHNIGKRIGNNPDAAKQIIDQIFQKYDTDKNDYLDYDEVEYIIGHIFSIDTADKPKKEELLAAKQFIIENFDLNQDGLITKTVSCFIVLQQFRIALSRILRSLHL